MGHEIANVTRVRGDFSYDVKPAFIRRPTRDYASLRRFNTPLCFQEAHRCPVDPIIDKILISSVNFYLTLILPM